MYNEHNNYTLSLKDPKNILQQRLHIKGCIISYLNSSAMFGHIAWGSVTQATLKMTAMRTGSYQQWTTKLEALTC